MEQRIGSVIAQKRKRLGMTQQRLAEKLHISFQAVSKWENGSTAPDISLLPQLACILETSVDELVGHHPAPGTHYEQKYSGPDYYWGVAPNELCCELLKLRPPVRPYHVLDIGCGEGKDAVFLARCGYRVSAFDLAESGLEKARRLAHSCGVQVDFFRADLRDWQPEEEYDVILSSGVFHYLDLQERKRTIARLKEHTAPHGLHAINVFVAKPFIPPAPDLEEKEVNAAPWHSGELFGHYHDWLFHRHEERVFDCSSSGIPHKHCMDVMIAEKME